MSIAAATVRLMTGADVRGAQTVTGRALGDLQERLQDPAWTDMPVPNEEALRAGEIRYRCFVESDPGGAWVAEAGGEIVGVALALRRERLWGLSLLMVDPAWQSAGIGGRLLRAALEYGHDAPDGIIMASADPRALRAYVRAGFDLQPEMVAYGPVDRDRLPAADGVRPGSLDDVAICDRADRHVRGSARGHGDLTVLLQRGNKLHVVDDERGCGYVCVRDGEVALLAATTDDAATRLLGAALATTPDGKTARVTSLTGEQNWAFRVVLEAGMRLSHVTGGILTRGNPGPMTPYLANGAFL